LCPDHWCPVNVLVQQQYCQTPRNDGLMELFGIGDLREEQIDVISWYCICPQVLDPLLVARTGNEPWQQQKKTGILSDALPVLPCCSLSLLLRLFPCCHSVWSHSSFPPDIRCQYYQEEFHNAFLYWLFTIRGDNWTISIVTIMELLYGSTTKQAWCVHPDVMLTTPLFSRSDDCCTIPVSHKSCPPPKVHFEFFINLDVMLWLTKTC